MSTVGESLEELLDIMGELAMPATDNFLSGLPREEITSLTQDLGLSLAPELIELYEFRNGVLSNGRHRRDISIYYGYWMLPLHEAAENYRRISHWDEHISSWFPVLYCDGDYFHLDCQAAEDEKPSVVAAMLESDPEVEYSTLSSMFHTFAECYKQGAFVVTDGVMVDHDELKVNQIGLQNNPDVRYWYEQQKKL